MKAPSRRALLALGALGVGGLGVGAGLTATPERLIASIIRRSFGDLPMTPDDRAALHAGALAHVRNAGASDNSMRALAGAFAAGLDEALRGALPHELAFKIEEFERQAVTYVLVATDVVAAGGMNASAVRFIGWSDICGSPFAQFDPEA